MNCPEKRRLTEAFTDATRALVELHNREMKAVLSGNFTENPTLHAELKAATALKDKCRDELRSHLLTHGC
jgi:hypothetical protein